MRLTTDGGFKQHLRWSPDGKHFLMTRIHEGRMGLWVMNADGSDLKASPQARHKDAQLRRLLVARRQAHRLRPRQDQRNRRRPPDHTVNADGSDEKTVVPHKAFEESPRWSPDGKRIVWVSTRDGNQDIYTTDLEGKDVKRLTNDPAPTTTQVGRRTARHIAFCSGRSGHLQIYVMDADGGNVRRLTNHDGIDYWPVWSPDGKRIAFTSNRDGNYEIYVMDADGGNQHNLTRQSRPGQLRYVVAGRQEDRVYLQPRRRLGCLRPRGEVIRAADPLKRLIQPGRLPLGGPAAAWERNTSSTRPHRRRRTRAAYPPNSRPPLRWPTAT